MTQSPHPLTANLPQPGPGQRRLFLKSGCPFCTKLVVFLAAAGIHHRVKPILDCPPVRDYVKATNDGRCTFPALEVQEGQVMLETLDIMAFLRAEHGAEEADLWVSRYFEEGMLQSFGALFGYLIKQEGGYEGAKAWFADHGDIIQHPCPPEGAAEVL